MLELKGPYKEVTPYPWKKKFSGGFLRERTLAMIYTCYLNTMYIDYFMVGERVRFLFTSCEESQTHSLEDSHRSKTRIARRLASLEDSHRSKTRIARRLASLEDSHRNQEYCNRKRSRKSTTVRSVLHTKVQTYHQLPRRMQRIRGPFILKII